MPKNVSKTSFASLSDKGIIHQFSYPHMLQLNFLCYQNARIDALMRLELSCFICMYPNVFKVMQSSLHALLLIRCLPLFLIVHLLTPPYFWLLQAFIRPLESLGVFVMSITLGWALLNFILAPQSVPFLVIPRLEGAIDANPQSCSATFAFADVTFVESQSYFCGLAPLSTIGLSLQFLFQLWVPFLL